MYPNSMYILGYLLTSCQFPEAVFQSEMEIPVAVYEIIWGDIQMNRFYFRGYVFILMTIRKKSLTYETCALIYSIFLA